MWRAYLDVNDRERIMGPICRMRLAAEYWLRQAKQEHGGGKGTVQYLGFEDGDWRGSDRRRHRMDNSPEGM